MSGFLQRLAMRARGTAAAENLPLVRAVPALYGPRGESATSTPTQEEQAGASASAPAQDLPNRPAAGVTLVGRGQAQPRAAVNRTEQSEDTPPAPADLQPAREANRVEVRRAVVEAPATMNPPVAEEQPRPPVVSPGQVASGSERTGEEPQPAEIRKTPPVGPHPPVPPQAARLERLFEAIEDVPAVGRQEQVEQIDWGRVEQTPATAPDPPVISIGRIDISVVPPAPREAPARTRGFDSYARVRRGLDR